MTPPTTGSAVPAADIWQLVLGLVLVIVTIFVAAWLMRRLNPGAMAGSGAMRIVAALSLGPRERLMLVDVGGKQLLLGVTATQINAIHAFDEPVVTPGAAPVSEFGARLLSAIGAKRDAS